MEFLASIGIWAGVIAVLVIALLVGLFTMSMRRVVPTNEVHIVQQAKKTTPYGKGEAAGNVYYNWPAKFPVIGLTVRILPVSVFAIDLIGYEAYDKDRVPFHVDVKAFFRVSDPSTAAARVESTAELEDQLEAIVQGAVRTTLAKHDIHQIMTERSIFGGFFTTEVEEQLKNWGVETVKNIELMDIRDTTNSKVIHNIMAVRTSEIEKDSRISVASNRKMAETAEIEAQREVNLQELAAEQQVGLRKAENERAVGIAEETAKQEITTAAAITKAKEMEVVQIEDTRRAEIARGVAVVRADEQKQTSVIAAQAAREVAVTNAEAEKQQTTLVAEGNLEAQKREAEGIAAIGTAKAEAEKAMQLAPVQAQLTLAEGIGSNEGYQDYLLKNRNIEAMQAIGVEQAKALTGADVKVIANTGANGVGSGLTSVMDLFTPTGGTAVAGALEALSQTEAGKAVVGRLTGKTGTDG